MASRGWRVNASSHGFRTCPYPAARRRQDRFSESLALRGPADRALRCTSTTDRLDRIRGGPPPDLRWEPTQGAIGAVDWMTGGFGEPPSIRTTRRLESLRSERTAMFRERSKCQVGEAQLRNTRDTPAVSIFSFIVSIHVFI